MTRWWSQYTHKGVYKDTARIKCNLCTQHNGWLDGSNYYKAANNHYNKFHSELKPEGISNTGTIIGTVSANVANRAKRIKDKGSLGLADGTVSNSLHSPRTAGSSSSQCSSSCNVLLMFGSWSPNVHLQDPPARTCCCGAVFGA